VFVLTFFLPGSVCLFRAVFCWCFGVYSHVGFEFIVVSVTDCLEKFVFKMTITCEVEQDVNR